MKKILFLLVLIYTFSNASCVKFAPLSMLSSTYSSLSQCQSAITAPHNRWCAYTPDNLRYAQYQQTTTTGTCYAGDPLFPEPVERQNRLCSYDTVAQRVNCILNPDPLQEGGRCRDLFQKDGTAYTCNPNTNEATPIPNSSGTTTDPTDGKDIPNCNSGYEYTSTPNITVGGSGTGYNSWGCAASTGTGDTGSNNGGTGTGDTGGTGTGTGEPSISYGGDGSVTMTLPDGTKQTTYGDGWVTTTYPDGTTSSTAPHSSGGSGTSGGGGGSSGSGTSGNTTNETTPTPTEDTPIDNTPVATSCSDSALTLQEKMLCELNAGMKKQNSEGNPSNSLNQLLKDLKTSNQTDNTAINTNLKDIESGTVQLVNKQTQANTTLDKINNSANATELYNKVMTEDLNKLVNNTQDAEGKSYLSTISEFVDKLTTPVSGDDKNSYSSQISSSVNSSLSSTLSKYSNVLGFGSTYANRPENITMTIFNQQYILIDFAILDPYISIIRSLFLTLAYLYGFMNLIRSSR